MRKLGLAAVAIAILGGSPAGCGAAQTAAAKDPLKCERDPTCAHGRSSYQDCYQQCVDDPQCVERCESVQQQVDGPPGGGGR